MANQDEIKKNKISMRDKVTLSRFMSGIVFLTVFISSSVLAYYAFSKLYDEKVRDTWSLLYLEVENLSHQLSLDIESDFNPLYQGEVFSSKMKRQIATYMSNDNLNFTLSSGDFQEKIHVNELNIMEKLQLNHFYFTNIESKSVLIRNSMTSLKNSRRKKIYKLEIWPIDIKNYVPIRPARLKHTIIYILNRAGKLLHRNYREIDQATVIRRPLVQHFMKSKYKQAQVEIPNKEDEKLYGFFFEVPNTNVVIFAETTRKNALSHVRNIAIKYGQLTGLILIITIIVLNLLLKTIRKGILELIAYADQISLGRYYDYRVATSFGEINILSRRFNFMSRALVSRDKAIEELLLDRENSIKLEASLEIAKNLQENFLPSEVYFKNEYFELASFYKPTEKVGGDWYNYHIFDDTGVVVVAIADVSGHGPGASMFTAVISAVFDDFIEGLNDFDVEKFVQSVNRRILSLGKSRWMATVQIFKYDPISKKGFVYNSGHVPPISVTSGNKKAKMLLNPSIPLGIEYNPKINMEELDCNSSINLLLYTDCLFETENPSGQRFKKKKMLDIIYQNHNESSENCLEKVLREWELFHSESAIEDDLCLIKIKIL